MLCGLSAGCSQVYVSNGLPEGDRADIPGLDGRWSLTVDRQTGEKASLEVIREGRGDYRIVPYAATGSQVADPETGEFIDPKTGARARMRVKTFLVDGQAVFAVRTESFSDEPRPFPILLKADISSNRL